jgi:hypothetical protein
LGLASFHPKKWWFNEGCGTQIVGLGSGYYFWMASFCILLVGCFITQSPYLQLNTGADDKVASVG